jgi:hypothetical protein
MNAMFLSHWLKCLGRQGRYSRRISAARRSVRPTLEALETRDVPTVSLASSPWPPPAPSLTQLMRELAPTPFGASADGERPMTHQQAVAASAYNKQAIFVHSGQSIQAAINSAQAGSTIYIDPGVYTEHLVVNTADIHLVGLVGRDGSHVTLINPGQGGDGVQVDASATGFSMRFLEVRGFQDGVSLNNVQFFRVTHLLLSANTDAGIEANNSSIGVIQYTDESGSAAAGIKVENSNDVQVHYNRSHSNVVGVEVVDSTQVEVVCNNVFDNTAGIVATQLPGGSTAYDLIADNYVSANNRPNFAAAGSAESGLVQGTGILLQGASQTTVVGNLVLGNQTMGVGVVSTPPQGGVSLPASNDNIVANWVIGNGFHSMSPQLSHGVDLYWDGLGQGNHWANNFSMTTSPGMLPS